MKHFNYLITTILLLVFSFYSLAQNEYLVGYEKEVAGVNFAYPSPYLYNDVCYLTRATEAIGAMEWETAVIPKTYKGKTVSFIWLYGIDVTTQPQNFELSVNGNVVLTFSNPISNSNAEWKATGDDGVELNFYQSMIDSNQDQMGYAVFTLPTA